LVTSAPQLNRVPSDEELMQFGQRHEGYQIEFFPPDRIIMTPPAGGEPGYLESQLLYQLTAWAERQGEGMVFSPSTGFRLRDNSMLCPDAAWVRKSAWDRLSPAQRKKLLHIIPEAVFELASPSNTRRKLRRKLRRYLDNGVMLAVLVDPKNNAIEIHRPGAEPEIYADPQEINLSPELPGFGLDCHKLFNL
jgi:Uma2 family endonuclease